MATKASGPIVEEIADGNVAQGRTTPLQDMHDHMKTEPKPMTRKANAAPPNVHTPGKTASNRPSRVMGNDMPPDKVRKTSILGG